MRLCFVVESGTDVRLVEGLAEHFDLTVLARRIEGGVAVSQPTALASSIRVGPASRTAFARLVLGHLAAGRRRIDAVLVQGYALAALAANLAGRVLGLPTRMLVCSPTELYYRCRAARPAGGKSFRRVELLALHALARANARVGGRYAVLSSHLADVVRGHGGRTSIEVVPVYGVDLERFRPGAEPRGSLRSRLGLPQDAAILFFSSRVAPEKDADTLLAALRVLADRGRDVRLLSCSGGHQELAAAAHAAGVADRVIARDAVHPQRELPDLYRAADVCVQASREEGLGFSPLEALACGTPVVAAAVGGLRETIVDGATGWTYPRGDVRELAARIEDVLGNPAEARARAAAGRRMVEERFERRRVFGRLAEILRGDAAQRRRAAP